MLEKTDQPATTERAREATGRALRVWTPYLILALALVLTFVAAYYVRASAETRDRLRFENAAQRTQNDIQNRLETYIALLRAGAGLFAASDAVSPAEFRAYVRPLELRRKYPGIQGIGFTVRLRPEELAPLAAEMRRQGFADFQVRPPDAREEYHAIIYLEPQDARNRVAMGYDMFSEPVRREAMARARDTGLPAASGRVRLVQEIDENVQAGFLIYMPVYRNGAAVETLADRQAALQGFVYSPFRADDLLAGIFTPEEQSNVDLEVYDGAEMTPANLLHQSDRAAASTPPPRFTTASAIEIAGRPWHLRFSSRPELNLASGQGLSRYVLLGGLIVSFVLFLISLAQARARAAAEQAAQSLRQSEAALREAERRAIDEYERLLDRLVTLAQTLGTARDLLTIYRALGEFCAASMPCVGLFISLYDERRDVRTASYAWAEGEEIDVSRLPPMPITSEGPNSRAVRTGEIIVTDEYDKKMQGRKTVKVGPNDGVLPQSSLVAPMAIRGRIIGTVETQSYERAAYTSEHITAIRMAANLAAVAIEITQLFEQEHRARALAESSNRLKDEFLATLSHELRTPLTAILGWSALLRSEQLDEETKQRALETIERNARAQTQLVDDLLDVSRIITGKLRLDLRPVRLAPIIEATLDSVRPAAHARKIQLAATLGAEVGVVPGDPDRLQQVVWNLLSNAVKFTPQGGRVEVRLERVDSAAQIIVADTGQGISAEFLPHVFDRFRQADSSTTRVHGGLGLGLAITRHLVELHGGQIRAVSAGPGQGATFTVSLPLMSARAETEEAQRQLLERALGEPSAPSLAGLQVLVVEDESDTRELVAATLRQRGAQVEAVASAAAALAALEKSQPDVLVSDIAMPEADGYELIRRIRARETEHHTRQLPAAALTAYTRAEDRERALAAGFQAHISKPVKPAVLAAVVAELGGRDGKMRDGKN